MFNGNLDKFFRFFYQFDGKKSNMHRATGNGHDLVTAVKPPFADTRTVLGDFAPPILGSQVAKPERKRAALQGAYRINATTGLEKQTASLKIFNDAVTRFEGITEPLNEFVGFHF